MVHRSELHHPMGHYRWAKLLKPPSWQTGSPKLQKLRAREPYVALADSIICRVSPSGLPNTTTALTRLATSAGNTAPVKLLGVRSPIALETTVAPWEYPPRMNSVSGHAAATEVTRATRSRAGTGERRTCGTYAYLVLVVPGRTCVYASARAGTLLTLSQSPMWDRCWWYRRVPGTAGYARAGTRGTRARAHATRYAEAAHDSVLRRKWHF